MSNLYSVCALLLEWKLVFWSGHELNLITDPTQVFSLRLLGVTTSQQTVLN